MASRLAWRRVVTAGSIYGAAAIGFLGTVVAARALGPPAFGLLAIVLAAQGFFQLFLDLTVGDALVKYGFRYVTNGEWGRLRRLFAVALRVQGAGALLGALAILALVPFADTLFGSDRVQTPLALSALLPLAGFSIGVSNAVLLLHGRYEFHGIITLIVTAARFTAMAIGSQYGVTETVVALVVAHTLAGGLVAVLGWRGFRRFPAAPAVPLGDEAAPLRRFVISSTAGTTLDSFRGVFPPLLLGIVATPTQVAFFRAAQAAQYGFSVLSAPARIILLTEQTRDVELRAWERVVSRLRRYTVWSSALMLVVVPPAVWLMPELVELVYGASYAGAADPARLIVLAAALQLVVGWTKPFPISIGRPNLRVLAHGIEILVLVPVLVWLGSRWEATGAAGAVLVAVLAFVATWVVLALRLRAEYRARPPEAAAP